MPVMERRNASSQNGTSPPAEGMEKRIRYCQITITAGRKRLLDPDNICCKQVLDAIKGEGGFIEDDNAGIITSLVVRQEKTKTPYTMIEIEF
jgi:Holliday junction resolvase RusA-like endonuclease